MYDLWNLFNIAFISYINCNSSPLTIWSAIIGLVTMPYCKQKEIWDNQLRTKLPIVSNTFKTREVVIQAYCLSVFLQRKSHEYFLTIFRITVRVDTVVFTSLRSTWPRYVGESSGLEHKLATMNIQFHEIMNQKNSFPTLNACTTQTEIPMLYGWYIYIQWNDLIACRDLRKQIFSCDQCLQIWIHRAIRTLYEHKIGK